MTRLALASPSSRSLVYLLIAVWWLPSCGPVIEHPTPLRQIPPEDAAPPERYLIQPGDELEIRYFYTPELDITLPVRPDGYIALPLIDEVAAEGRTAEELRGELVSSYAGRLKSPEISVIVRTFSSNLVHVGGRVEKPGVYPLTPGMRVLDALIAAEGQLLEARMDEIVLIRKQAAGSYLLVPINLALAISGADKGQNVKLLPYDCLYVPPSPIGEVNDWVDLYLRKNIPIQFGLRPDVP